MEERIRQVRDLGQRLWLDNLSRLLLRSGELERLRERGVSGITSNPTIFQKAVSASSIYDEGIRRLSAAGRTPSQIVWDLMIEDVSTAADVLRPVYDASGGADGFVSIEVSPEVAHSPGRTLDMVRELRDRCARPNVMIKIPATREGLTAIRSAIAEGTNINVTLIFAVSRYEEVVEAYLSGLEDLLGRGGDPARVHSVASFFVSRVDTKVDALIDGRRNASSPADRERLEALRGTIGIANSKVAYERFAELHSGTRWAELERRGAHPQMCLWASTSVKDGRYPDTMYADGLIGPDTIDTLPEAALEAFVEHGAARRTLDLDVEDAHRRLSELAGLGIDLGRVTDELEQEGVRAFAESYERLTRAMAGAADAAAGQRS